MNIWLISGCSSGLGRCWTHSIISERGDMVIGITRSKEAAEEMKDRYKNLFIPCVANVEEPEQLTKKMMEAIDTVGIPNRVVTAAGFAQFGTLEDLSNQQIREQFSTNVEGTLNVIKPLLPMMRNRSPSRILLVSSMSGVACWPLLGAYQISKYAIEAISDTLRHELSGTNIQVGCIEPGPHKTGWATTYARRTEISTAYDAMELRKKASCGYVIQDPTASLPYFWKMFDTPIMPKRIATSKEFVNFAVKEAEERIREWRAAHGNSN
jgi:NADP-dependent 3-hydroxy acid dehydrogenase YdfG